MNIVNPAASLPIILENGTMAEPFRLWTQQITRMEVLMGTGSPETVVDAPMGKFYFDDAGTAGAILYIKRDTDIGGDPTKGWVLV